MTQYWHRSESSKYWDSYSFYVAGEPLTTYQDPDYIRWLKKNDIGEYFRRKRERRRLKRRFIGYTEETRLYLKHIVRDPCVYCGDISSTIDHVIPRSKGGSNHWWNLVPACASCNNRKGSKDVDIWVKK